MATFTRGSHTFQVPMRLFLLNRQRLCKALKDGGVPSKSFVILQGGTDIPRYNTDVNYLFRQESFFHWAFGVEEPDFCGAISVDDGKAILFMPKLPDSYRIWSGTIHGQKHFQSKYEVDEVFYTHDIAKILKEKQASQLFLLQGKNTDSDLTIHPASFDKINDFKVEVDKLYPTMAELRVFKTDLEIDVLRYICRISCDAHVQMMKNCKPGLYEYQLESVFLNHCYYHGGARCVGYTSIGASGCNCAVLHYGHAGAPNNKEIKDGDLCLFDMGAEYCCYTADITTVFPANGKFTEDQKFIYNAVLKSNQSVMKAAKPGVSWLDMHLLSQRTLLECLLEGGLLKGSVDDMMKVHLGAVFMPHGLGHFLGLDVHDVHGYPPGSQRVDAPSLRNLRTIRVLQHRMVITIEPGCYFINTLLDEALKDPTRSKFLNESVLNRFRGFGGVRIEDDVLITQNGTENLSPVVRDINEIEAIMKKK